jgi:hypothetical protein
VVKKAKGKVGNRESAIRDTAGLNRETANGKRERARDNGTFRSIFTYLYLSPSSTLSTLSTC